VEVLRIISAPRAEYKSVPKKGRQEAGSVGGSSDPIIAVVPAYYALVSLIECVPNISEGRRPEVVEQCAGAIGAAVPLLDVTSDRAHNRSVLTFAGEADAVRTGVLALFDVALATIDLRRHEGEHPRVGAVDVVPFVPLGDATMAECVELAHSIAETVADRYDLPVYLYEEASRPGRHRRLEQIRRGGLPALTTRMSNADWRPDFGPSSPHPTAGVTVIGARRPLVAYNVELATDRVEIARAVARDVRQSSGGQPPVKPIGLAHADHGIVQVSMNLTDFRTTSIVAAFDAVEAGARSRGVSVIGSELIGLAPATALTPAVAAHVRLRDFNADRMVLERRLAAVRR
jgi:glutamate formiminotransferase